MIVWGTGPSFKGITTSGGCGNNRFLYGGRSSVGLERLTVDEEVVGSNPTCHPKLRYGVKVSHAQLWVFRREDESH